MTSGSAVPSGEAPRWRPSPVELDDVELALLGVWSRPEMGAAGFTVSVVVPSGVAAEVRDAAHLVLIEEEGAPYAALEVERVSGIDAQRCELVGSVVALSEVARGSHRWLRRPVSAGSEDVTPVLGFPLDRPLPLPVLVQLSAAAERLGARLRLLPLTGHGRPRGLDGPGLVRSCLAVGGLVGADVVPVALADHGHDTQDDVRAVQVAAAYGATYVAGAIAERAGSAGSRLLRPWSGAPELVELPDVALDVRTGRWAPTEEVPGEHRGDRTLADVTGDLDGSVGARTPIDLAPFDPATRRELRRARPRGRVGVVILFTGLSGSGKSTIARALHERILDRSDRAVTVLDGDVVRQMLSSELGFSREHRVLNVRRIGFVAAQIAAHGGIALCAPIAPYESTRCEVEAMVEQTGSGFLLVHVATPLEVCEARDRKGLYRKARAGTVPEFTGISDLYEVPHHADLTVDTTSETLDAVANRILTSIAQRGWIELDDQGSPEHGASPTGMTVDPS